MRSLLSTLVATAVGLHSVLGCCWHHAHAWEGSACDSVGCNTACCNTACCEARECDVDHDHDHDSLAAEHESMGAEHDHDSLAAEHHGICSDQAACRVSVGGHSAGLPAASSDDHSHHGQCPGKRCPGECADKCAPVVAGRVQLEFQSPAALPLAIVSVLPESLEFGPSAAETEAAHEASAYPPHERTHLLLRLLLI